MELKVKSIAGTLESSDIQIIVEPTTDSGILIDLESVVMGQYEEDIRKVILEVASEMDVTSAKIYANDKGAISAVIKSRVQTALHRASQQDKYIWKKGGNK
ncbi:MAG: citrate lyase acyl carrier protein [Fusobacteriaceae bacterium]